MTDQQPVTIVMVEDDEGHARLIERNIRRAGISNDIKHFTDGTSALDYLFNHADGPTMNGPAGMRSGVSASVNAKRLFGSQAR